MPESPIYWAVMSTVLWFLAIFSPPPSFMGQLFGFLLACGAYYVFWQTLKDESNGS